MRTEKNEQQALARQIAMEVGNRRKAGENISDESVLREYPHLRDLLLEQLKRLRFLEAARQHVDEQVPAPPAPSLDQTTDQPLTDSEMLDSVDENRLTIKEPPANSDLAGTLVIDNSGEDSTVVVSSVPLYRPSVRAPMAVLRLFHDGLTTYNSYPVMTDRFRIGRVEGELVVPHDFWMSGRHAEIQRRKSGDVYRWFLVDLKSTNGTFVHTETVVLKPNDELFLGQERYRFIRQGSRFGLMHVTTGSGQQWWFTGRNMPVGSQPPHGLSSFEDDPYLDPVHAILKQDHEGNWTIKDNNSRNGVWYRIKEVELAPNCQFQLGEQRFGFWSHADAEIGSEELRVAQHEL